MDEAILAATIEEIAVLGSLSISIESVARRAGVNKTTVYRRFADSDELVLAAVLRHADEQVPIPDTGSLRGDLLELCRSVRSALELPLGRALMAASRTVRGDSEIAGLRDRFWVERFESAATVIERAERRGEGVPPGPPSELVEQLMAPVHFRLFDRNLAVDDGYLERLVNRWVR